MFNGRLSLLLLLPVALNAATDAWADNPLTITAAGTYAGDAWSSNNPNVAAVTITTSVPSGATVTITSATITSRGHLIDCQAPGINLVVYDVDGHGQNPHVAGKEKGDFVHMFVTPASVQIFWCYIESVSHALELFGDRTNTTSATIDFNHNLVRNIDGRLSNGSNGYQATPWASVGASCVTIANIRSDPNISITWNEVRNYQGQALAGDLFDLYDTSGTASSYIQIADNFVRGQFPNNDSETGGRGVFVMDGDVSKPNFPTQYVNIHDNLCVGCEGYPIYLYWGNNFNVYDNRVVTSMVDPSTGAYYQSVGGGIGLQDATPPGSGWTSTWHVYNNVVGAMGQGGGARADFLFEPASLSQQATGNTSLTSDPAAKISLSEEDAVEKVWAAQKEYPNTFQNIGPISY
jgi:hypothetical protein